MLLVAVTRKEIYNPLSKRAPVKNPTSYVMLLGKILKQQWKHRNGLLLFNEVSAPAQHTASHGNMQFVLQVSKFMLFFLVSLNLCSVNS